MAVRMEEVESPVKISLRQNQWSLVVDWAGLLGVAGCLAYCFGGVTEECW